MDEAALQVLGMSGTTDPAEILNGGVFITDVPAAVTQRNEREFVQVRTGF